MQAAPRVNLIPVNRVDLFAGQKVGLLFQRKSLSCVRLFGETTKQTGVQCAGLPMGFPKPLIGSVADSGNVLVRPVFSDLFAKWRMSTSLQVIGERVAARSVKQRFQMCVPTNSGSEAVAIGLPNRIDACVTAFLTNLPVAITVEFIEAGPFIFSPLALSGSFLWHATPISDSSEPEPHSQLGIGFDSAGARSTTTATAAKRQTGRSVVLLPRPGGLRFCGKSLPFGRGSDRRAPRWLGRPERVSVHGGRVKCRV